MQRLFSMFPHGVPGIGLLILRLSVAAIFFINAISLGSAASLVLKSVAVIIGLISVCLSLGFLTPYLAVVACLAGWLNVLLGLSTSSGFWIFAILDSAALTLLGPGAYSIDARLFGLRVTVVPPRKDRR